MSRASTEATVVTDDGVRLRTRVDGPFDAPPLLLLGSLGTDLDMWDPQVATWSATHRVLRFDPRGHGSSDAPAGPYTVDRLGRDAISVLDAHEIERPDVCGLSLGGLVALWLAAHAPDRVRRLVLADTADRIGTEDAWRERASRVREAGMAAIAPMVLERFFSPGFLASGGRALERTRSVLIGIEPEGYAASCEALATADLRDDAHTVRAPALIVVGDEDVATPPDVARDLASRLPDARVLELPGAGHLASIEEPDAFAGVVSEFLGPDGLRQAGDRGGPVRG